MSEWVTDNQDRPFGIYVPVLRHDKHGYYQDFLYYDNQIKSWATQSGLKVIRIKNVTHYFILPEPPKGE